MTKTYIFEVEIEKEGRRWSAHCPALVGCATWGRTKEEAFENIQEAVEVYVEDIVASGEKMPRAKTVLHSAAVSVVTS